MSSSWQVRGLIGQEASLEAVPSGISRKGKVGSYVCVLVAQLHPTLCDCMD